jgi:tRNA threonylcarbamoyl adenosine modification protein (Sua5/YciO/YrdC/YwlC family)
MAETISLTDLIAAGSELNDEVASAVAALREGQLIIAPIEHAYVFVADAFNHGAVKKMHILRGDALGVAAQVIVGDIKTATGITSEFGETTKSICEKFWPGLLTLNIAPAQGLVWDLGDARSLAQIAIRVPATDFLRRIALEAGPLAIASANRAGAPPKRRGPLFPALDADYAYFFDEGELTEGPASTVISVKSDGVTLTRTGAISLAELRSVTPNIAVPA